MTIEEISTFLDREFPQIHADGSVYRFERIAPGTAVMRLSATDRHLRPGGTVSGPSLMTLADLAAYVVILGHIGPVALAVTTNLNINFLVKPQPVDLLAEANILRLSRRQAVCEVSLYSAGNEAELVAHVTGTYALPI